MTISDHATFWCQRGYYPVPIPYREKGPQIEGWQKLRITATEVSQFFNGAQQNIGVLCGEPYGLCDVDLDSPQALLAFPELAPDTGLIFGRPSKPRSHYFYRIDPPSKSVKYLDPVDGATLLEFRCLKSDGSVGLQTVVPPSVHPSGERIEFWRDCNREPANVDVEELGRAVRWTAAVSLLARHWPQPQGGRHDAFLALAGALVRAQWSIADATQLVGALYRVLWPGSADLSAAIREVESTFQRHDDGHEITGLPHLMKLVPPAVIKQIGKWLGFRQEPEAKPVFQVRSLPSVWTWEHAEPEWIVEGLIAAGSVNLITGDSGVGKSTLMLELAGAIAHGKPFLGRETKRRPVLYVDRENPLFIVKERLLRLRIDPTPDLIVWGTWADPWPEGPTSPATIQFARAEKPVIVFDSLISQNTGGDEQNASEMRRHMEGYRKLATLGATPAILHNTGKSETAKWFRGSSDIKAAIDTAYLLEPIGGGVPGTGLGSLRLVPFKSRLAPSGPLYISYANGRFESADAPKKLSDLERFQQEVRLNPNIGRNRLVRLLEPHMTEHKVRNLIFEGLTQGWLVQSQGKGRGGNRYWLRVQEGFDDGPSDTSTN